MPGTSVLDDIDLIIEDIRGGGGAVAGSHQQQCAIHPTHAEVAELADAPA